MPTSSRRRSDWLTLSEASRQLGVAPATLRRWSDAGRIRTFTTPGGHRRFARGALQSLLPSRDPSPLPLARIGLTPERLNRAYRRNARILHADLPWLTELQGPALERFRIRGRRLTADLLAWLDARGEGPETRDHPLNDATLVAAEYGREAAAAGLSLSQTVEGFLRFRAPFLAELARGSRRRGLDGAAATELLEAAETGMDRLLIAAMAAHSVARIGPGHPGGG
ncbi:MAG TPA: helix-turn-helix domain-containing protein [Candidatus Limnocylindrales bacterium]|jgi:excisionase family DNA binding protein|nr:helix-turn-helix domain-containing protein [Candidatus Limnocylindrales bacterium]